MCVCVCVCVCVPCFVHGSISMSLPYLLFTDKVSVEDRSPPSLCASPNCRLVFPIFLPKGQQAHISHICERPSSFFPSLAFRALNLHSPSSFNISPFIYFYLTWAESVHEVHMSSHYMKHFPVLVHTMHGFGFLFPPYHTCSRCKDVTRLVFCMTPYFSACCTWKFESTSLCSKSNGVRKVFSRGLSCK